MQIGDNISFNVMCLKTREKHFCVENHFRKTRGDSRLVSSWDARTRPQGWRTRVRRGDAAGTPQTARPCHVGPRRATWQGPNRADAAEVGADSAEIGADAAEIGPTRSVSAETAESGQNLKKKKKRCKRTVLSCNITAFLLVRQEFHNSGIILFQKENSDRP